MSFQTRSGLELIPGYRLIERLGTGGFGEVWKATAPGGLSKAVKIVFGHMEESRAAQELKALDRIKTVRHPFLLSLERVEIIDNQLLIVTELAERSLLERFQECRNARLPGIPRDELLIYMRDAAEALDYMNENFGLQHLDIKPQNLLLLGGRIKIADFGLVKDLRGGSATITGGVTPFYATPEAFDGRVSRFSDQYSLAIVYQEMLTGLRPFPGTTTLQLALQHGSSKPLLHPLPVPDRPIIARALSKIPDQRFPTCRDLVAGLVASEGTLLPSEAAPQDVTNSRSRPRRKSSRAIKERESHAAPAEAEQAAKLPLEPSTPLEELAANADSELVDAAGLLALTRPTSDAGLRPTLLIGLGGIAGWTLCKLRQKLHRQFGDLSRVPALRLLQIDTDRSALHLARQGEVGEALEVSETLFTPLQRPEHYRRQSAELLKWLERHWLYNIPRSLLTEGLRPLGRLALVSNLDEVLLRLREIVTALTSGESRAATVEATGSELRSEMPHIFIVTSISGGTGSGAALDLAYAVRQVLREQGKSRARISGILVHATNQHPAEADLARLNAFVTLNELQHYGRQSTSYPGDPAHGLSAVGPGVPPFDDCYVVHLGDQVRPADIQAQCNEIAEYLYADMATPVGAFLERWRRANNIVGDEDEDGPALRGFGLHRYGFPKNRVARLAAGRFCRGTVARWRGEHLDCSEESMRQELRPRLIALGLESQAIEKLICAAALRVLGDEPEKYFIEQIAGLSGGQSGEDVRKGLSTELVAAVLARIDAFFPSEPDVQFRGAQLATPLETTLSEQGKELIANLSRPILQWLIAELDNPTKRLRGAYHAANVVRQQINSGAESVALELERVRVHQTTLRDGLRPAHEKTMGSGLLGLAGHATNKLSGKSLQPVAEYFLFRLKEQTLMRTLQVLNSISARVTEWNSELDNISLKLENFGQLFLPPYSTLDLPCNECLSAPAQTEMLPGDAGSLIDAAEQINWRLAPEFTAEFEKAVQSEVIDQYGGLWGLTCAIEQSEDSIRDSLLRLASESLLPALTEIDAAQLFLESRGDAARAQQELKDRASAIAPSLAVRSEKEQLIIGLPKSQSGSLVRELLDPASFTIPFTLLDTKGDIVFCHESAGRSIQEVAELLVDDPERYAGVAAQVTTRKDVAWSFFELAGTNP